MIYVVLGIAAVALAASVGALCLAVVARAEAITCRRELSSHRRSHVEQVDERRAVRHASPPAAPSTEQLNRVDLPTSEMASASPGRRLPRPGELTPPR